MWIIVTTSPAVGCRLTVPPRQQVTYGGRAFAVAGLSTWNSLPTETFAQPLLQHFCFWPSIQNISTNVCSALEAFARMRSLHCINQCFTLRHTSLLIFLCLIVCFFLHFCNWIFKIFNLLNKKVDITYVCALVVHFVDIEETLRLRHGFFKVLSLTDRILTLMAVELHFVETLYWWKRYFY